MAVMINPDIPHPNIYATMGDLSLKRILALTPGGSMGMPGNAVRAGKFDQPGMNGMDDMKGMDHGAMKQDAGTMNHSGIAPEVATKHAGHDKSEMAMEDMTMDAATNGHDKPGMVSHEQPASPRSTWFGLFAEDVSSKAARVRRVGMECGGSAALPGEYGMTRDQTPILHNR